MDRMTRIGCAAVCAVCLFLDPAPLAGATAPATKAPKPAQNANVKPAPSRSVARHPYVGAIVCNATNRRVLFEDQADARGYPASVLKLMDLLIVLEQVERGQLTLQDKVTVSARAARTGGSQVWLAEKEVFTVDELLYALMVMSANDAAVALAEKVAGSTSAFVELMNQRARELGMASTKFSSVHGLPPGPGQPHDVTTARDLARLCYAALQRSDTLRYTSTRERAFRPGASKGMVMMHNHNPLLGLVEGCDGLKTGYISAAGFSIAVTATRQDNRLIAVVLGSVDRKLRDAKAAELINRGFASALQAPPATTGSPPSPAPPGASPTRLAKP